MQFPDNDIKAKLISLADEYEVHDFCKNDPSQFLYWYKDNQEIEIAAFLAAMLSFGSRKQFIPKIKLILEIADKSGGIKKWILERKFIEFCNHGDRPYDKFYRFYSYNDLKDLFDTFFQILTNYNSLGEHIYNIWQNNDGLYLMDIISNVFNECKMVSHGKNSCHKRINMFLRWMVRDNSEVDLGIWNWYSKKKLFIPLDVHVLQEAKKLNLIFENSKADRKTLFQLSETLRMIWPDDPCKGDFALFGLGIDESV